MAWLVTGLFLVVAFSVWGILVYRQHPKDSVSVVDPGDDAFDFFGHISIKIRGINKYSADEDTTKGFIIAELHNEHDPYAIVIVDRKLDIIGYVPRGNKELHRLLIEKHNRYLPVKVDIRNMGDYRQGIINLDDGAYPELMEIDIKNGF